MLNIWCGVRRMVNNYPSKSLNFFRISYWYWFGLNRSSSAPLEVYNTTYFTLLGKKVKTLDKGLYIKVMQTNKGQVAEKIYFRD